jgi:hypothetical protein
MKKLLGITLGLGLVMGLALTAQRQRVSPHEKVEAVLGGKKVVIEYGRPSLKGRDMATLAPAGQVWRTGADEATTLMTEGDLMLGSLHVPAGTYALFTIPGAGEWTVIVNKTAKQWGSFKYDQGMDLGRVKAKAAKGGPTEQFTISMTAKGSNGEMKMMWGDTVVTVPVMMH